MNSCAVLVTFLREMSGKSHPFTETVRGFLRYLLCVVVVYLSR